MALPTDGVTEGNTGVLCHLPQPSLSSLTSPPSIGSEPLLPPGVPSSTWTLNSIHHSGPRRNLSLELRCEFRIFMCLCDALLICSSASWSPGCPSNILVPSLVLEALFGVIAPPVVTSTHLVSANCIPLTKANHMSFHSLPSFLNHCPLCALRESLFPFYLLTLSNT